MRPALEGDLTTLETTLTWGQGATPDDGWGLEVSNTTSLPGVSDLTATRTMATAAWGRSGGWRELELSARLDAGLVGGDAPPQVLFL